MRRLPLAFLKALTIVLLGLFGTVAGSIAAVFLTPAGRGLAGRTLSEQLDGLVQGDVEVGAVGGPLWSGLDVDRLVVRDTAGDVVLEAGQLGVHYHLFDLLAGRFILTEVTVDGLRLVLEKHRDGHWNIERILRPAQPGAVAGPTRLIRLQDLTIRNGEVRLYQPWNPPDSARTPKAAAAALAAERRHAGRRIEAGPEGYRKFTLFSDLGGRFQTLQISSPDHAPLRAEFDSLAVRVSDPAVDLRGAVGTAELTGATLRLDLSKAVLPASHMAVKGSVGLGHGGPFFALAVVASQVALRDLRGFVAGLPDFSGSAHATLRSDSTGRLTTAVEGLDVRGRQGRATGRLTAVAGGNQELEFAGLDLLLFGADPQAMGGWVDSIPLHGTLDGHVLANGPLSGLVVDADVVYRDSRVAGTPPNHLSIIGRLRLGGATGMVFDTLTLRGSDLDLATVRVLVPSNPLVGRAAIEGTLVGPWRAFTWRGTAVHRDGERPVSVMRGTVFLDTRSPVSAFDADVGLTPLVLEGLAGTWPDLPVGGSLRGTVRARGTMARFALDADLHGAPGHFAGSAIVSSEGDAWGFDSVDVRFDSLDLVAFGDTALHTQLLGTLAGGGRIDPAHPTIGHLLVTLGAGWIREVPIDSARFAIASDAATLTIDTAFVRWPSGRLEAAGRIARTAPSQGGIVLQGEAADLGVFDSLANVLLHPAIDTTFVARPLGGRAEFTATVGGALDSLTLDTRVSAREVAWQRFRLPAARATLVYGGGASGTIHFSATVDTATWGAWSIGATTLGAEGRLDSLRWNVAGLVGPTDSIVAGGRWHQTGDTTAVGIDSLLAALTAHTWRLARPATVLNTAGAWQVDSLVLAAVDGSGELRFAGVLPSKRPGAATLTALGLDLRDVMGLMQRDTVGVLGRGAADLTIGGTASAPLLRGTFSLSEGGFREFRAPYLQGAFDYGARQLQATVLLWRTGKQALAVSVDSLPIDLAFHGVNDRLIDGPLFIRATADSADLGLLEAFTTNLRRVRGSLTADVTLSGRWGDTRLGGTVEVIDAAATLPGLGVRWEKMGARLHLTGDSIVIDALSLRGGEGTASVTGRARFERGRTPTLDLDVRANRFRAMDVRNYLTLVASGRLSVKGPLFGATLTGNGRADAGALYFADLVTKQIVDLNDPATADLIDTALVREARLGPSFQNQFIDSLRIDNFRLTVGEDFWLRSADANIKLSGSATVNKVARNYRLDGTLTAERGQYTLKMGFITRDFDVRRGTVRFLGTPDLNAELDLTADHRVKATDGTADIDIQASITGTLLVPKLTLINPANPQMVETDIVSYLMFGRSTAALQGNNTAEGARQQRAVATAWSYLAPALSSEIERTLISDLGVPVDYIQIRPGGIGTSSIEGSSSALTTVSAGWQVGRQTYVALNAGICNGNPTDLSYRNFGASLEQRLQRDWRVTLSVEPVFTCSSAPGTSTLANSSLYQLGLDLLWDREY